VSVDCVIGRLGEKLQGVLSHIPCFFCCRREEMTDRSLARPGEYTLFRQTVIDFQNQQRQYGQITLLQPPSTKILTWIMTASVGVIILFVCFAQYTRKETVSGYLTPASGTARVFAPRPGVIREVHVTEGQQVEQGMALLTVNNPSITADGEDVDVVVMTSLIFQKRKFYEQIAAQERLAASERGRLVEVIQGLEAETSYLREQITTQSERILLAKESVDSAVKLKSKGNMTEVEYRTRQQELLQQVQELISLKRNLASRGNDLVEARYALEQLPSVMQEKVQLTRNELSEVEQRIAEIDGRRAYVIRASRSGRVSTLQARVGQTVNSEHLQLEIMPADSALQADLFVPTRAIGFVRVNQKVRILYDAFPYQRFGVYGGQITKVSQAILTKSDMSGPVTLQEPAYKVTVALDRSDVDAYGQKVPLQADMILRADILLDKQSLLTWLLDPLLSVRM
jgi:membrane fusion protein